MGQLLNAPQVQIIDDQDHQTVVKITGCYTAACTANTLVVQSNTLFGANTSLPCILAVNSWEYSSSLANGFISFEWVSNGNTNTTIMTCGRFNDGTIARYIPNNANTPTGDVNMWTANAQPGDSFSITISFLKQYQGQTLTFPTVTGNVQTYIGNVASITNYGAGAWANAQAQYRNPGGY
jgi:uncharacterized membrane protein